MEEKHFYYAEINESNVCIAILDTPTEITDNPKMILTDTYDLSVLGKKYNNGVWETAETSTEEYTPTETELIQAELLLNQQDIIIKQSEHDEVLAAILLGQQTV